MAGQSNASMQQRPSGREILDHLQSRKDEFVAFLRELTVAESPSSVPASQDNRPSPSQSTA